MGEEYKGLVMKREARASKNDSRAGMTRRARGDKQERRRSPLRDSGIAVCTNVECRLRKTGCKGFEGCPGYKGK